MSAQHKPNPPARWARVCLITTALLCPAATFAAQSDATVDNAAERSDLVFAGQRQTINFETLGARDGLRLRTVQGYASMPLNVRRDQLVTKAHLDLHITHSPALRFEFSHLNVLINDEPVATLPLELDSATGRDVSIAIQPALLQRNNRITFEGILHYAPPNECEDPTHSSLWLHISKNSSIKLEYQYLDLDLDLKDLPLPLFDPSDQRTLTLPFAFASAPGPESRKAAAIVASWFGAAASYRGATFPVRYGELPSGHGVVMLSGEQRLAGLNMDNIADLNNRVFLIDHPTTPQAALLVLWGRTDADLVTLATGLAAGDAVLDGSSASVTSTQIAEQRDDWDAQGWINVDDGEYVLAQAASSDLTVWGLTTAPVSYEFSLPPDTYPLSENSIELDLGYRVTPIAAERSALNVSYNREFIGGAELDFSNLSSDKDDAIGDLELSVPQELLSGRNRIDADFHLRRNTHRVCEDFDPFAMRAAMDPGSKITFKKVAHFAELPALEKFANGGYPYSRKANLNDTVLLLPAQPDAQRLGAALTLVGHVARWTGEPALSLASADLSEIQRYSDKDMLVIAPPQASDLPESLRAVSPIAFQDGGVKVRAVNRLQRLQGRIIGRDVASAYDVASEVAMDAGTNVGALMQYQSPWQAQRSVIVLGTGKMAKPMDVAQSVIEPGSAQYVRGGLALTTKDNVSGYALGKPYSHGKLPLWYATKRWFQHRPYLLFAVGVLAVILFGLILVKLLRLMAGKRTKE